MELDELRDGIKAMNAAIDAVWRVRVVIDSRQTAEACDRFVMSLKEERDSYGRALAFRIECGDQ
jgi:hypothetical protein